MKVTIMCDEGHVVWEGTGYKDREHIRRRFEMFPLNVPECPICHPPQPTYGPLTVEMVAEALATAWYYGCGGELKPKEHLHRHLIEEERDRARFVIRLLNEFHYSVRQVEGWDWTTEPRDWLLRLAVGLGTEGE